MKITISPNTFVALLATWNVFVDAVPLTAAGATATAQSSAVQSSSSSKSSSSSSSSSPSKSSSSSLFSSSSKSSSSSAVSSSKSSTASSSSSSIKISSTTITSAPSSASAKSAAQGSSSSSTFLTGLDKNVKASSSSGASSGSNASSSSNNPLSLIATYTGGTPESTAEAQNANQVQCKVYKNSNLDSLAVCTSYCGNIATDPSQDASVTCNAFSSNVIWQTDDQGNQYALGVCQCNLPIMTMVGNILVQAAEAVGEIGCELMFGLMTDILEVVGLAIPGVDELEGADAATQIAVKAANAIADKGGDALDFINWLGGPCPSGNYSSVADDIYLPLIGKRPSGRDPHGVPKVSAPKETIPKETAPRQTAPQETAPKETAPKTTAPQETAPKTTAPEETSAKTTADKKSGTKTSSETTTDGKTSEQAKSTGDKASKTSAASSARPTTGKSSDPSTTGKSTSGRSTSQTATSTGQSSSITSHSSSPSKSSSSSSSLSSSTSSASSTSSSSSSSACSYNPARATKRSEVVDRNTYVEPDCQDVATIIKALKSYDTNEALRDQMINNILIGKLMSHRPGADSSMFYANYGKAGAETQTEINGKENEATVFWGYDQGPFNPKLEPMKTVLSEGLRATYLRATSRSFARVSSGKAFFVYDENWATATGEAGKKSVFLTDDLPELMANSRITEVVQITNGLATLWNPETELTLLIVAAGSLNTNTKLENNEIPVVKIFKAGP